VDKSAALEPTASNDAVFAFLSPTGPAPPVGSSHLTRPGSGTGREGVKTMAANGPTLLFGGRYEVGSLIGQGGMGRVYEARDTRLHRNVAIKIIRSGVGDERQRQRFEQEARSAARLNHPNVTAIYDVGDQDDESYIVMERLSDSSLADRLREGPLPAAQARQLALDLLSGLGAAHGQGILHRDIKPSNILFSSTGSAKLADFGIALLDQDADLTETGMIIGSAPYMPPERLHGQPATACGDLYSLGVVLYEALAGRPPFEGDTPFAVAQAIDATNPVSIGRINAEIDRRFGFAVDRAMRRAPDARFASAASMAAAIEADHPVLVPTVPQAAPSSATETLPAALQAGPSRTDLSAPVPAHPSWSASTGDDQSRGQRRPSVRRVAVVAAVLVAGMVAVVFGLSGGVGSSPSPTTPTTSVPAPPSSPPATAKPVPPPSASTTSAPPPTRGHGRKTSD
jgi:serine/threonine protein kinase